jgi:hypothetical protein
VVACNLYVLMFWISGSVSHEIKSQGTSICHFYHLAPSTHSPLPLDVRIQKDASLVIIVT